MKLAGQLIIILLTEHPLASLPASPYLMPLFSLIAPQIETVGPPFQFRTHQPPKQAFFRHMNNYTGQVLGQASVQLKPCTSNNALAKQDQDLMQEGEATAIN
mmetsp:Transcript_11603/g.19792  ORF Transcript_11603/g.19792 Transcript_11603/m.19792 type:complete len:102 (+) Transcript_11603:258-563(+)